MTWNKTGSILGTGNTNDAVGREADIIFTAAFIGMTVWQNQKKPGVLWRVHMEPNLDGDKNLAARTEDDQKSMRNHNDACSKVNYVVHTYSSQLAGVGWGLTPTFDRGGMICAGEGAKDEYAQTNDAYRKTAYKYLTASQQAALGGQRSDEMYVGRGAYCGLVLDSEGDAVAAMSTIRTTLSEHTPGVGDRWCPPPGGEGVWARYNTPKNEEYVWGMITSVETQTNCKEQGMRFFPKGTTPKRGTEIVGYTHGLVRAIYETVRMGQGTAFEMSIGTDTFKLASCLSCSSFMMANGVDASASHLGAGESWVPYYDPKYYGKDEYNRAFHNASHYPDKVELSKAVAQCNASYAACMHGWMTNGVKAMSAVANAGWVNEAHKPALIKLHEHLEKNSTDKNTVARDLYLDAMTYHRKDVLRLNSALAYAPKAVSPYDGMHNWMTGQPVAKPTENEIWSWKNPFTDEKIAQLHIPPAPLINRYTIKVSSAHKDDSCALGYSLLNAAGKEAQKGQLTHPFNKESCLPDDFAIAEFTVAAANDVTKWKIKFDGDKDYSSIRLDQQVAIGSGDRYSYTIINTNI